MEKEVRAVKVEELDWQYDLVTVEDFDSIHLPSERAIYEMKFTAPQGQVKVGQRYKINIVAQADEKEARDVEDIRGS